MKKIFVLAFVLLSMAQASLAQYNSAGGFASNWEARDWKVYALAAVLICIGFNGLVYMLGEAFSLDNMKRWAKAEFLQVSASSLMILFVSLMLFEGGTTVFNYIEDELVPAGSTITCQGKNFGIFAPGGTFASATAGGGPIEAFKCKLQENIYVLDGMYTSIYNNNLGVERSASTCWLLFGMNVYCGSWNLGVHQQVEQAHLLGEKIVPLQVALHGQFALAEYISKNMLSVFLPLGIVLRVFPITRGAGGLLIAIAIGFYFVFPLAFVMLDPSFVKIEGAPSAIVQDANMCYPGFKGSTVLINSVLGGQLQQIFQSYAAYADQLARLTVHIMFYPFVALALALIFVRAAAPILGGDTGEIMRMVAKLT